MADDKDVKGAEVTDKRPEKKADETHAADLSTKTQEKTDALRQDEEKQKAKRRDYQTASSADLPKLDMLIKQGGMHTVSRYGDKLAKAVTETDAPDVKENADQSKTKTYADKSKVEVSKDGKVTEAAAADGHKRDYKYDANGALTEVTSTFTGHTWKKTTDEQGKEAWVNEKGTVWKGKFGVDENGNLSFKSHEGFAYIFTRDGKTVKLPAHDAQATENSAGADGKPVAGADGKPVAGADGKPVAGDAKQPPTAEQLHAQDVVTASSKMITIGTNVRGVPDAGKVVEALKGASAEEIKIIKEQYKKAYGAELEDDLKAKFPGNREISKAFDALGTASEKRADSTRVQAAVDKLDSSTGVFFPDAAATIKVLQNSTEAEIAAIKIAYKKETGKDFEERLKELFEGDDLKKALHFLNRKDADAAQVPQGVDKNQLTKDIVEIQAASKRSNGVYDISTVNELLAGKNSDQIKAMNELYKERYGISLDDQLKGMVPGTSLDQRVAAANKSVEEKKVEKVAKQADELYVGMLFGADGAEITKGLAGKTEAEIKALDEAFTKKHGISLEKHFKEELSEPELSEALKLLHHKDADLIKIPEGADRAKLRAENEAIYSTKDEPFGGVSPEHFYKHFQGKSQAELDAMNALFKEQYGQTLEEHLRDKSFLGPNKLNEWAKEANEAQKSHEKFEGDVAKVDPAKTEKLYDDLQDAKNAKAPAKYMGALRVYGWEPGDHPAEKLLQNLSVAELQALKEYYKEKTGYELKNELLQIPYDAGRRLERILDREHDGALNKLTEEQRADAHERAEALYHAMVIDGTKEGAVYRALEKRSEPEREAIKEAFHELTGGTLEDWIKGDFSGDEEEKALNYLRYGSRDEASNLHLALSENSDSKVRSTIMTMTSKQIEDLDRDYQKKYNVSLKDAILNDEGLDADTKKAMEIYLKGMDKFQPQDWDKLMDISMGDYNDWSVRFGAAQGHRNVGNLDMFKQIMSSAPQDARDRFIASMGAYKISLAFREDATDALEYAKLGRLSTARKIAKNDTVDDDEDAIEKAIADMDWKKSDAQTGKETVDPNSERALYRRGVKIEQDHWKSLNEDDKVTFVLSGGKVDTSKMSEYDKKAYEQYKSVSSAIDGPCDDSECTDWRNNAVYPGGEKAVVEEINGLSKEDWKKFKENPAAKAAWMEERGIDLFTEKTSQKIHKLLDDKLATESFEETKYVGGKAFAEYLKPRTSGLSVKPPDGEKLLEGIETMGLAEQKLYRTDADFRENVDSIIKLSMNEAQQEAARHMLDRVIAGKLPEQDWIDKINIQAGKSETDEPQVIRYMEDEFRKSEQKGEKPPLFERVTNPQTTEDRELKERMEKALHRALEDDEYEKWAKPMLAHGRLTIEEKLQLDREEGDRKAIFKDITNLATAEDKGAIAERHKLVTDPEYRQRVLKELPEDQRQLAESILKHGEERHRIMSDPGYREHVLSTLPDDQRQNAQKVLDMVQKEPQILANAQVRDAFVASLPADQRQIAESTLKMASLQPEDAVRSYVLGLGVSKEQMMDAIKDLTPKQNVQFRDRYADKYHEDVVTVLADKLTGKDEDTALRYIRIDPLTAREALRDVKEAVDDSNSGFGAAVTSAWGSGAGALAEDKVLQLQAKILEKAAKGEEFSLEDAKKLANGAYEYKELFDEAKKRTADQLSDIVLSVATIAVPGGLALRSLLIISALGGGAKVAMKYAIAGDADLSDFASGMVDTALSAVGPAQIGKAVGLGRKAATHAAEKLIAKGLIKEGEELVLQNGLRSATAHAMADGSGMITDKTLNKIVNQVAKEGATDAEKVLLQKAMKEALEKELASEVRSGVTKVVTGLALDTGAGFTGGFGGGLVKGVFDWDSEKGFSDNMSHMLDGAFMSGALGAGGALGFSSAFKIAGGTWRFIKGDALHAGKNIAGIPEAVVQDGEFAIMRAKDAPAPAGKSVDVTPDGLKADYQRVGKSDYYVDGDGGIFKRVQDGPNGMAKLVHDEQAAIAISDKAAAKIEGTATSGKTEIGSIRGLEQDKMLAQLGVDLEAGRRMAQRSELSGAKAMDGFIDQADNTSRAWKDNGDLRARADASGERLQKSRVKYENEVLEPLRKEHPGVELDTDTVAQMVSNKPDKLAALKDYVQARSEFASTSKELTAAVMDRTAQLQKLVDDLADSQGLAHVKIKLDPDLPPGVNGKFSHQDGTLTVRESAALGTADRTALIKDIYHEFMHNEQSNLIVRQLAEELKLPKPPSKADLEHLAKEFKERVNGDITTERLQDVLSKQRNPLSTAEKARAIELAAAMKDTPQTGDFAKIADDLAVTRSKLKALEDDPKGAEKLLQKLAEDESGKLSQHLFGVSSHYKVRPYIEALKNGQVLDDTARAELTSLLEKRVEKLNQDNTELLVKYRKSVHEQEAFAVDREIGARAQAKGMGDGMSGTDAVVVSGQGKDVKVVSGGDKTPVAGGRESYSIDVKARAGADAVPSVKGVTIDSPVPNDRVYKVNGEDFELRKRPGDGRWFWGGKGGAGESPVKVHVMGYSPADLGELQKALIPALNKDPELARMVSDWKTFDPKVGLGQYQRGEFIPTGIGQEGKAFTIYVKDPADAVKVQQKIDEILQKNKLGLDHPINTGNIDKIAGASNRVGITRDAYPLAELPGFKYGYKLDDRLSAQIKAEAGITQGRIPESKLREIEQSTGLKQNTLVYDNQGNLALKAEMHGRVPNVEDAAEMRRGIYADEQAASKVHGSLTDRPALYALADRYGMDQAQLAVPSSKAADALPLKRRETKKGYAVNEAGEEVAEAGRTQQMKAVDANHHYTAEEQAIIDRLSPDQKRVLDAADIPDAERPLVAGWVERNPMADPHNIQDFARRADDVTEKWTDVSHLVDESARADNALKEAKLAYDKNVSDAIAVRYWSVPRSGPDPDLERLLKDPEALHDLIMNGDQNTAAIAKRLNMPEEKLRKLHDEVQMSQGEFKILKDYLSAQDKASAARENFMDIKHARQEELQRMVDVYSKEHNMPAVKIEFRSDAEMGPAEGFFTGDKILLKESALAKNADPAELASTIYHELVHSEQNFAMAKMILKETKVQLTVEEMEKLQRFQEKQSRGAVPFDTIAEMEEHQKIWAKYELVRDQFRARTQSDLSVDRLRNILDTPFVESLDASPFRARVLAKAFQERGGYKEYAKSLDDLHNLWSITPDYSNPAQVNSVIERLANDDGSLAMKYFGHPELSDSMKMLVSNYKRHAKMGTPFSDTEAALILKTNIDDHINNIKTYRDAHFKEYIKGLHETEAAIIDRAMAKEASDLRKTVTSRDTQPMKAFDPFADEDTEIIVRKK